MDRNTFDELFNYSSKDAEEVDLFSSKTDYSEEVVEEEKTEEVKEEVATEEVVEEKEEVKVEDKKEEVLEPLCPKKTGQANIVVVGVGGGGCNAVNNMIRANITSANFVVMNTDLQSLNLSETESKLRIQLGDNTTGGLGAGANPEIGRAAAEESKSKIKQVLQGVDLLFITAGMGGGTGTGAAPVIAEIAKEMNILTVAVVTKPFMFEGAQRMKNADDGIRALKKFVDTLLVIPNQKLTEVLPRNCSFKRAFEIADDVLRQGIQGVSDVIAKPELINLDFADVKTILSNKGLAHMGIGIGKGEKRIIEAVKGAVCSPLLETSIEGATGIIVNISGGDDMSIGEVNEACEIIRNVVDPSANIILGTAFVPQKKDVEITIIATGSIDRNVPSKLLDANNQKSKSEEMQEVQNKVEQAAAVQEPSNSFEEALANRPVFGGAKPVQPAQAAPQAQPVQAEVEPAQNQSPIQEEEIVSSRINVSKKVPSFIRRLRGDK